MSRKMKPVRSPMFTARTDLDMAIGLANAEEVSGHLVSVCCVCISDRMRAALSLLGNVSHGYCAECESGKLRELVAEVEALPDAVLADAEMVRVGDLERRAS
jgi:hypothetical protein